MKRSRKMKKSAKNREGAWQLFLRELVFPVLRETLPKLLDRLLHWLF
ncbi:MAG: hypothetical protein ABF629_14390 [Sporolactobacillus sp.]